MLETRGACHEAREYSGASDHDRHRALVMWESGGKRENDRDPPNMGGPNGQRGERHTSSLPPLLY